MLRDVDLRKTIRVFSGVRTVIGDDFIIEKDKKNQDIINDFYDFYKYIYQNIASLLYFFDILTNPLGTYLRIKM